MRDSLLSGFVGAQCPAAATQLHVRHAPLPTCLHEEQYRSETVQRLSSLPGGCGALHIGAVPLASVVAPCGDRLLAIPQLPRSNVWAIVILVMRGSATVSAHRGLSPHQFTPMSGAHEQIVPMTWGAVTLLFQSDTLRALPVLAHPCRWASIYG
jgi:hypothetical protein